MLHLQISLEQRDSTPAEDQRMDLFLTCELGDYFREYVPIPVRD